MGVLACNRNACTNIMCDRYSAAYGYICDECFDELVASCSMDISSFMKSAAKHELPDLTDHYNKIFLRREEW